MTRFRRKSAAPNLVRIIPVWHSGPACQKTLPLYIIHDTCFEKRLETPIVFYARPDNTLRVCECPNDGHELFCGMAEKLLDMPPQHRRTSFYPAVWARLAAHERDRAPTDAYDKTRPRARLLNFGALIVFLSLSRHRRLIRRRAVGAGGAFKPLPFRRRHTGELFELADEVRRVVIAHLICDGVDLERAG